MGKNISTISEQEAWKAPPCPKVLEMRRAHRQKPLARPDETVPSSTLGETTRNFIEHALDTLLTHVEGLHLDESGAKTGHISNQTASGLKEIHLREPGMEAFTYGHSLEWQSIPEGLGLPVQVQLVFKKKVEIKALEKLKEEILKALIGQKDRVNTATEELWGRQPTEMTMLWGLMEELEEKTRTENTVFYPDFIKVKNYSPQKSPERPYLKEGFNLELENENYIFNFYPNESGAKTILKISARPLKGQSLNDDPIDPLLLLESSEFTTWVEEILKKVSEELEGAKEGEWHDELAEAPEGTSEVEPSIRATLEILRLQLRETVLRKLTGWLQ